MNKFVASIICIVITFSSASLAFANAGPTYWQGYPGAGIMSIAENTPIVVNSENLVFDFSGGDTSAFSLEAKVHAMYKMQNPTSEQQVVQMAFPFVTALDRLSAKDIVVTDDGQVLSYGMYIGDVVESFGDPKQEDSALNFSFAQIIRTISDDFYEADSFTKDETGKLYTFEVQPTTDQRINFFVDFNLDDEQSNVLTSGFNRYTRRDQETSIGAWCYGPETLEIFVLGDDIDFTVSAYTDGELKEKTDLFNHDVSTQHMTIIDYLQTVVREEHAEILTVAQSYNLYAQALDRQFLQNRGYSSTDDLLAQDNYERVFILVYSVVFAPHSEKEVSVAYRQTGTMDMTRTAKPLHSFDYLLNPAKHWANFKDLNITVMTPTEAPYMVSSNIEFSLDEPRVYSASLAGLPDKDLTFTLYANEKITLLERTEGLLRHRFSYLASIVIGVPTLLAIAVLGALVLRPKRK